LVTAPTVYISEYVPNKFFVPKDHYCGKIATTNESTNTDQIKEVKLRLKYLNASSIENTMQQAYITPESQKKRAEPDALDSGRRERKEEAEGGVLILLTTSLNLTHRLLSRKLTKFSILYNVIV